MSELISTNLLPDGPLADIRALIAETRRQTAVAVNTGLTVRYWRIGKRIHLEVLGSERQVPDESRQPTSR